MYIDKLDDIVDTYNNTYHRTIKIKPVDIKPSIYFNFNKENNEERPVFKVGDNVRISKHNFFLQKTMFQIGLNSFLGLKTLKIRRHRHMLLVTLLLKK